MSRFYEALKEASRSPEMPKRHAEEAPLAAASAISIDLPPIPEFQESPSTNGASLHPDAHSALDAIDRELHFAVPPVRGQEIGTILKIALDGRARVLPHMIDPSIVEYYRRIRTKILQEQTAKPFRSLLVASPNPQDGKTVTVLNLGFSLAMLPSFKVLVVDGDLRKGTLGKWLGVGERPGFCNLLDGSAKLEDVVLKSDDNPLHFMVSGQSKAPAAELLNTSDLSGHFRRMAEHFDLILVDSPPVNLMTDSQLLADATDAVLLVARAFLTTRKSFEKAVQDLRRYRILGTILNDGKRIGQSARRYGYYGAAH